MGSTYGIQPSAVKWTSIFFIIFSIYKDYTWTLEFHIFRYFICNHKKSCGNKEITLQSVDYRILFYKALFFPKTLNMQIYKNQYVLIKSISVNPQLVWFYCLISPISDKNHCWFLTFPKTYPLCVTNVCRSPSFLNISTTISIGVWSVIVTGAWKQ